MITIKNWRPGQDAVLTVVGDQLHITFGDTKVIIDSEDDYYYAEDESVLHSLLGVIKIEFSRNTGKSLYDYFKLRDNPGSGFYISYLSGYAYLCRKGEVLCQMTDRESNVEKDVIDNVNLVEQRYQALRGSVAAVLEAENTGQFEHALNHLREVYNASDS